MRLRNFFKPGPPLAYPYYFVPVFIIALIGFGDSIYLAISHYRNYMDMGYQSFCAISRSLNCDTVSQSDYSIFLNVPVAVWGILGYGLVVFLLVLARPAAAERKRVWTLLFIISLVFSVYGLALAYISAVWIQSYCLMCILSYAVNLALLFYAWIIRNRFECESFFTALKLDFIYLLSLKKITVPVTSAFGATALVMVLVFPPYWHMDPPVLSGRIPAGLTEAGHPWIGAEEPGLEIVEFADYMCFQCRKMHYHLRRLIEAHPGAIRLIHRHFPMDHEYNPLVEEPFYVGSGRLALIALYAKTEGVFWEASDLLFSMEKKTIRLREILEPLGLDVAGLSAALKSGHLEAALMDDIYAGLKLGISATPAYVVNGQLHTGTIPADIINAAIRGRVNTVERGSP